MDLGLLLMGIFGNKFCRSHYSLYDIPLSTTWEPGGVAVNWGGFEPETSGFWMLRLDKKLMG